MTQITEARGVTITKGEDPHRFLLQLINPGMGSSGYYSTEVLEAAVEDNVFPAGTHLYADHPTPQQQGQPRSVRDLAGVLESDGVWNPTTQAIEATCKVYPHYGWLSEVAGDIGMSIRADGEVSRGTIGGQQTQVIDKLTEVRSVDFVSKAGRGGKILAAIESARDDDLVEGSVNDTRDALTLRLRETYGAEKTWVYVQDFDPEQKIATFSIMNDDDTSALFQQGYAVAEDLSVSLDGDRREVRAVTNYVPVTTTTEESSVEITEAAHNAVVSERDALKTRLAESEQENTVLKAEKRGRELRESATDFVGEVIGARLDTRPDAFRQKVIAEAMRDIPTSGDQLDQTKMRTRVENAITAEEAYVTALGGGQTVIGHGASTSTTVAESEAAREASRTAQKNIDWN